MLRNSKLKRYMGVALLNVRRRKRARATGILLFLTVLVYMGFGSGVNSVINQLNALDNDIMARSLIIDDDKEHTLQKQIEKEYAGSDKVESAYSFVYAQMGTWVNVPKSLGNESMEITLRSFHPLLSQYASSQKAVEKLETGEILIPRYFYGYGDVPDNEYVDGNDFVGNTFTAMIENPYNNNMREYEFKVAGTYDNIQLSAMDEFYIEASCAEEIMEFLLEDVNSDLVKEEVLTQTEEESEEDEQIVFVETQVMYYTSVCLKDRETLDEFAEKYGGIRQTEMDADFMSYLEYLKLISQMIVTFLLLAAVIQLILAVIHETDERKYELALMKSMGYPDAGLLFIVGMEYFINACKSFVLALLISLAGIMYGNYIIQHYMSVGVRSYHLQIFGYHIGMAVIFTCLIPVVALYITFVKLRKIQTAATLKERE